MAKFKNQTTGVVVSVDDSKADRFADGWDVVEPAPKRRAKAADTDSK